VANYSFELPDTNIQMTPSLADQGGSGWTWDNALVLKPASFYSMTAVDGDQAAQQHSGLSYQTTGYAVSAGDVFTLTIAVGHAPGYGAGTTYGMGLCLDDPNSIVSSTSGAVAGIAEGTWQDVTVTYTATAADAGKYIGVRFSADSVCALFDYVRLDVTPAPEPTTMSLVGLGGIGLLLRRKK
jgi:hypothetical protein